MPNFAELDALVDANQSVTTLVLVGDQVEHRNPSNVQDRPWRVYSITKSIVSLLVGVAEGDGLLAIDDPVAKYVPAWANGPSADVTVRHLLSMTSGRRWSPELDNEMIFTATDITEFAVGLDQEHPPGTSWQYDNIAAQVLEAVLTSAVGDLVAFAQRRLFAPIGMTATAWERDLSGHPLTYAGITSTAADLGRLGRLMLNGGRYDEEEIVPESWIEQATTGSSELNAAYGLLWWTNTEGTILDGGRAVGQEEDSLARSGRLAPSVPADAYWALGWGSQFMAVVPSRNMVAIRLGRRPRSLDDLTIERFTATAVAGLD